MISRRRHAARVGAFDRLAPTEVSEAGTWRSSPRHRGGGGAGEGGGGGGGARVRAARARAITYAPLEPPPPSPSVFTDERWPCCRRRSRSRRSTIMRRRRAEALLRRQHDTLRRLQFAAARLASRCAHAGCGACRWVGRRGGGGASRGHGGADRGGRARDRGAPPLSRGAAQHPRLQAAADAEAGRPPGAKNQRPGRSSAVRVERVPRQPNICQRAQLRGSESNA